MRTGLSDWKQYYESVASGCYEIKHVLLASDIAHLPKWIQGFMIEKAALPPLPAEMAFVYGPETSAAGALHQEVKNLYQQDPTQFRFGGNSDWYRNGYLQTVHWIAKRSEALSFRAHQCGRCGAKGATDVHHRYYRLFFENIYHDLEVLCRQCHQTDHSEERVALKPAHHYATEL